MQILNMRKIAAGNIKAFFTLDLIKLKIHGCKLIQQPGQKMWCRMPDEKYTDKNGNVKYKNIVEISDIPLIGRITTAAVAEYEKSE